MGESVRTADVPAALRFDFWRQVVSEAFVPLEASRSGSADGAFRGELRGATLGAIRVYEVDADSHVAHRSRRMIDSSQDEYFKLGLQLESHSVLSQDGREAALRPGDFAVYDTTRPYRFSFDDGCRLLVLIFPRPMLGLPVARVGRLTATPFAGRAGLGELISSFLVNAARIADDLDARDCARLGANVLDLLATALAGRLDVRATDEDSARRSLMLQAVAFIESHLGDPLLAPADVAAAQHISTRYLHKLFHAEGTTVSGWIRQRRLERCRHDLRDPALAHRSVSAVAARWGLVDASHFSRLFRAAFGISPRAYRETQCTGYESFG
jgi:AraC-like DNA-binding protein